MDDLHPLDPGSHERLWTPWRMRYVGGGARETGCIFCNRLAADDDAASLVLHRGEHAFVILNLFPYNSGHLMIVPNAHVSSPEDLDDPTTVEMARLLPPTLRALRRVLGCAGFNTGINIGDVAGAGIAAHLHQHVVPRWVGDANFMPILAGTMVMPELIPITYAKIRADLARELDRARPALAVISDADAARIVVTGPVAAPTLPPLAPAAGEPLWKALAALVPDQPLELLACPVPGRAIVGAPIALAARVDSATLPADLRWIARADAAAALPPDQAALLHD
jgi:ATP adenylyltransferase